MRHRIPPTFRRLLLVILTAVGLGCLAGSVPAQFRVLPYPGSYVPSPKASYSSYGPGTPPYPSSYAGPSYAPYSMPSPSPYSSPYGFNPYSAGMNYGPSGFNPYAYPNNPLGGYFSGGGIMANTPKGGLLIDTQEADLLKQQVASAGMSNRRQAYEEYLYEKSITDNLNDQQAAQQQEELRQALASSPLTEVWSGRALNTLLAHIQTLDNQGVDVPDLPLIPQTLRQINVSVQNVGAGLLKQTGNPVWPLALKSLSPEEPCRRMREQIDALLLQGKKQALETGHVDADLAARLNAAIARLRTLLIDHLNEFSFSDFAQAKDFLGQLDRVVHVFQQPDAGNFLNGKYRPRGGTVTQLARYMAENRLQFAPSNAGEEVAYSALYQALVQYDLAASAEVAQTISPPLLPQPKPPG